MRKGGQSRHNIMNINYILYYDLLCSFIEDKHLTAEFLTSDKVLYIVALWNKTTNISDEMMSPLPVALD